MNKLKHLTHCSSCKIRVLIDFTDDLGRKHSTLISNRASFKGNKVYCEVCMDKPQS